MPVAENVLLPTLDTTPPLWREHRLYQADWLLRFYGFTANELLDQQHQSFNPFLDPKCNWALHHMDFFPININRAPYSDLLRVPGIGVNSAKRIVIARRSATLQFNDLKKLGVVLKRAQYFITCGGKATGSLKITQDKVLQSLMSEKTLGMYHQSFPLQSQNKQLSLFEQPPMILSGYPQEDLQRCLTSPI